jgi:hypothetical protein
MKPRKNPLERGKISERGRGIGTVTRRMVKKRAAELAETEGLSKKQVGESEVEEARRELTGQEGLTPEPTPAEELPEDKRWDPVPESVGHEAPKVRPPDEQTVLEHLVEEGVAEAEHEQMTEAEREERRREREERKGKL